MVFVFCVGLGSAVGIAASGRGGVVTVVVAALLVGVLCGPTGVIIVRSRSHLFRFPGISDRHQGRQLRVALRTGQAPADPALDQAALAFVEWQQATQRWALPLVVVMGVLAIVGGLVMGLTGNPFGWVSVAFWLVLLTASPFLIRSARRRGERVRAAIQART